MIEVMTETGSVYLLDGSRVLRVPDSRAVDNGTAFELRKDDEWVDMLEEVYPEMDQSLVMRLVEVSDNPNCDFTLRITTPIVSIEEIPNV